jgi:hypothetical protein
MLELDTPHGRHGRACTIRPAEPRGAFVLGTARAGRRRASTVTGDHDGAALAAAPVGG